MVKDRVGLMIIRAWVEDGSPKPLRAHIRLASDVSTGIERAWALSEAEDVCAAVDAWLRDVLTV